MRRRRLAAELGAVGVGVFEVLGLVRLGEFEFEDPTGSIGIGIDEGGVIGKGGIDFDDLAIGGGVDVGGGFDGLDHSGGSFGMDDAADVGEFDEDDVTEFVLGVIGDADGADVAIDVEPLVGFGVAEVAGDVHGFLR